VKKVPQARYPKRSKKAKEPEVSLEAHASTISSADVSNSFYLISFHTLLLLYTPFLRHY
jgi:hypothetical protein